MITPSYVRTMARYNSEMNRRVYAGAAQFTDEQRRADRGLFWKSLHGTLSHLMWGDRQWMSRFSLQHHDDGAASIGLGGGHDIDEAVAVVVAGDPVAARCDELRPLDRELAAVGVAPVAVDGVGVGRAGGEQGGGQG